MRRTTILFSCICTLALFSVGCDGKEGSAFDFLDGPDDFEFSDESPLDEIDGTFEEQMEQLGFRQTLPTKPRALGDNTSPAWTSGRAIVIRSPSQRRRVWFALAVIGSTMAVRSTSNLLARLLLVRSEWIA